MSGGTVAHVRAPAAELLRVGIYTALGSSLVYGLGLAVFGLLRAWEAQNTPPAGCLCGGSPNCTCKGVSK